MTKNSANFGWNSDFPTFRDSHSSSIRQSLNDFVTDASPAQIYAWDESIPLLQTEVSELLNKSSLAKKYETILEYELPMESRRTDAIFLTAGGVLVIELKGKSVPSRADIDQAAAYGRDLRSYHRECHDHPVYPVLVPTRATGYVGSDSGVAIIGPDAIDAFVSQIDEDSDHDPLSKDSFLSSAAYKPLPTLVQAARELMQSGTIRRIHRADAATEPTLHAITEIIHEAVRTKTRRLILITGVPGAGKTLVGLQIVHAHFLDDLAVPREDGKPIAPAVFLSGNGPLVEVLQYELKSAGGGGKVFVRDVKKYVQRYSSQKNLVPPEHVLVFDEAQRAFDAEQVKAKHSHLSAFQDGKSEPEHFVDFAERIPEWCVILGLIGNGQEIHIGEEGGIVQWRHAVEAASDPSAWKIHVPTEVEEIFSSSRVPIACHDSLSLDTEIRYHLIGDLHNYVSNLLEEGSVNSCAEKAKQLEAEGYHLRITRNIDEAKDYLRERYNNHPQARYGLIASSKDKELVNFGVYNDYQSTKRIRFGPWYGDNEEQSRKSCRHLESCITEFGAQGLELDAVLLAWGTDLMRTQRQWSNARARGYRDKHRVRDAFQLRRNAYRVLLTRGRDATVVFVPPIPELDETYDYLFQNGFRSLS